MKYRLKYRYEMEDFIAASCIGLDSDLNSPSFLRQNWSIVAFGSALLVAVVSSLILLSKANASHGIIIGMASAVAFYAAFHFKPGTKSARELAEDSAWLGDHEVSFDSVSLRDQMEDQSIEVKWRRFRAIRVVENFVVLAYGSVGFIYIKASAFGDEAELNEFVEYARRHIGQTHKSPW